MLLFSVLRHRGFVVGQGNMRLACASSPGLHRLLLLSERDVGLLSVDYLTLRWFRVKINMVVIILHLLVCRIFSFTRLLSLAPVNGWVIVICEEFVIRHCNF